MNYEFSLNKSSLISITAGCVVISVLLFAAGLVVGSQWLTSTASAETMAKNNEPDVPQEPVLIEPKTPAPKAVVAPPGTTAPAAPTAPKQPAGPMNQTAFPEAPPPQATTSEAANGDEIKIIQEAAADTTDATAAAEPDYVTVQIGVFLDEKQADHLLKEYERKGYAPSFFTGLDAEARKWYAVRIGAYSDKQQAANAAANFTKQEKMKAVVRPLGSL
jgi:hypothetical protein